MIKTYIMIQLHLPQQQEYSRGQALLRALFGWAYLGIPGAIIISIFNFITDVLSWVCWWIVVFTGDFPEGLRKLVLDLEVSVIRWYVFMFGLRDGYPEISPSQFANEVALPERSWRYSRGRALLLALLLPLYGFIYGIISLILWVVVALLAWIQFFVVMFTGGMNDGFYKIMTDSFGMIFSIRIFMLGVTQKFPGIESADE